MSNTLGITKAGLKMALRIKDDYRNLRPLTAPGETDRLIVPELLMNHGVDLFSLEDPMPLAMVAVRDPEGPMALAAAARLSPKGGTSKLLTGMIQLVGEASRHDHVRECVNFISERDFDPSSIAEIRRHTATYIIRSRQQYTAALRDNLQNLLDGTVAPRQFVREFFELTEAGNMRHDIRKKLVLSLLLSATVRPSVKFLLLENFERMPRPVQVAIISGVFRAEPSRHIDLIKEELQYIVISRREADGEVVASPTPQGLH